MDASSNLTPWMWSALEYLGGHPELSTATWVGQHLTGRKSAYGPQTSAREGGCTLRALERRRLVYCSYDDFRRKWMWNLTQRGRDVLAMRRRDR